MAHVIRRVSSKHITETFSGISCDSCGCGWSNRHVAQSCEYCGGTMRPHERRIDRYVSGYVLVRCACGREVQCEGFTSTCARGRDYNWAGQELAPRSQWGEETGEHWSDILRGGDDD